MPARGPTLFLVLTVSIACTSTTTVQPPRDAVSVETSLDGGSATDGGSVTDLGAVDVSPETQAMIAARPYRLRVSGRYTPATPAPLLIVLHGYSASGLIQEAYFRMTRQADARGFLYAIPDGTVDSLGHRFWNASPACCDFGHTNVDDVAYITAIIDDVSARYAVDRKRVFLVGHSNGGFMAHRMACDRARRIAAIVSLAGAAPSECSPDERVSVLEVHGTSDETIIYDGGSTPGGPYMGAVETISGWAMRGGCDAMLTTATRRIDLDVNLTGSETRVQEHLHCATGAAAELWSIEGAGHLPALGDSWATTVFDWLEAHAKP